MCKIYDIFKCFVRIVTVFLIDIIVEPAFSEIIDGFVEVAEYRNGSLMIKTDRIPKWLNDLKTYLYG